MDKMSGLKLNIKRAMVFGAHADDDIIGCGGTLHSLASNRVETRVVTFTGGETAANRPDEMPAMLKRRIREMQSSDKILKVAGRESLRIPTQQVYGAVYGGKMVFDENSPKQQLTLHQKLIKLIRHYRPGIIFTHSPDNHRDHCAVALITPQAVFQASESILGHLGKPWNTPLVLYYCIEGELQGDYSPNFVREIKKKDLEAKLAAMRTQESQTRGTYLQHFEEMIRARAQLWGAKSFGAGRYAEPFHLSDKTPIRI
jgi:LmbE family N-acetylglucosaminyl deacetylase